MNEPYAQPGFGERGQEPFGEIPTEPEAFLRWASQRKREEGKFELSRGKLGRLLAHDQFDLSAGDFAVRTGVGVRSPDIVVDRLGLNGKKLSTSTPILIAEVLSPSTAGTDFTAKLEEYASIDTLQTYLICAQEEPRAWVWSRPDDGSWPKLPTELAGREGTFRLGGLDIDLSMAAIFRGIPDPPTLD